MSINKLFDFFVLCKSKIRVMKLRTPSDAKTSMFVFLVLAGIAGFLTSHIDQEPIGILLGAIVAFTFSGVGLHNVISDYANLKIEKIEEHHKLEIKNLKEEYESKNKKNLELKKRKEFLSLIQIEERVGKQMIHIDTLESKKANEERSAREIAFRVLYSPLTQKNIHEFLDDKRRQREYEKQQQEDEKRKKNTDELYWLAGAGAIAALGKDVLYNQRKEFYGLVQELYIYLRAWMMFSIKNNTKMETEIIKLKYTAETYKIAFERIKLLILDDEKIGNKFKQYIQDEFYITETKTETEIETTSKVKTLLNDHLDHLIKEIPELSKKQN